MLRMIIEFLYNIPVMPFKLIFEYLFCAVFELTGRNVGLSLIIMSLAVSILVLPFYYLADKAQKKSFDKELWLKHWRQHIKKSFKGDERVMMLSALDKEAGGGGVALSGLLPLLMEIPVFLAAYQALSGMQLMDGVAFGIIADLGSPDHLFRAGNVEINMLPVLMTVINIISGWVYLPKEDRFGMTRILVTAMVFLALLYFCPSGLVLYWTFNNIFSLIKNLLLKSEKTGTDMASGKTKIFPVYFGLLIACGAASAMLTGLWLPSAVIASSPLEFVDVLTKEDPNLLIISSVSAAIGLFVFWPAVLYILSGPVFRKVLSTVWLAVMTTLFLGYYLLGSGVGTLSDTLQFNHGINVDYSANWRYYAVMLCVLFLVIYFWIRTGALRKLYIILAYAFAFAGLVIGCINCRKSEGVYKDYLASTAEYEGDHLTFELSKTGINVVEIIVDSQMGVYVPYLFSEKPELFDSFDGFRWYQNTISLGNATNVGIPSVYGGYEYSPAAMNMRSNQSLESKHNEALRMLPVLFSGEGYEVTVFDPAYAGYRWIPDLSVFADHPEIRTGITSGAFNENKEFSLYRKAVLKRDFFMYGLAVTVPYFMRDLIYLDGSYGDPDQYYIKEVMERKLASGSADLSDPEFYWKQFYQNENVSMGVERLFMDSYTVLDNLESMTQVTEDDKNTYMSLYNATPHDMIMLQRPEYEPEIYVDNTGYENEHPEHYTVNGVRLNVNGKSSAYDSNMATLLKLGEWLDYLKAEGVYDNTRIVIVADHGAELGQFPGLMTGEGYDLQVYTPILMFKDFNTSGFDVSQEPMTNADTPALLTGGLIADARNPFTGNRISDPAYKSGSVDVIRTDSAHVTVNNGNCYLPAPWYSVDMSGGLLYDPANWNYNGCY